jgi:hypothetical protein
MNTISLLAFSLFCCVIPGCATISSRKVESSAALNGLIGKRVRMKDDFWILPTFNGPPGLPPYGCYTANFGNRAEFHLTSATPVRILAFKTYRDPADGGPRPFLVFDFTANGKRFVAWRMLFYSSYLSASGIDLADFGEIEGLEFILTKHNNVVWSQAN